MPYRRTCQQGLALTDCQENLVSFTIGTVVVPSSLRNANAVGVNEDTRMLVTSDYGDGTTTVKRESDGMDLGGWNTSRFAAAPSNALAVGDTVTIVADGHSDCHGLPVGTRATVAALTGGSYDASPNERITIKVNRHGYDETYYAPASDVEKAPEVETLSEFKIRFLNGAIARGEANGATHAEQVREALDRLAGLEYLDPSLTLEDFQKRVVALAMEKKKAHSWCGEPEAYLTEIGLAHLLPVVKRLTVTIEVPVSGDANWSRRQWREAARKAAAENLAQYTDPSSAFSVPSGEFTRTNDIPQY
jgi:hypothetical protein